MLKTSQKVSITDKLKDAVNISGLAAEHFFNAEFKKLMDDLRQKDDNIRSIALGKQFGQGSTGKYPDSLKSLLKSIKQNINRREYISSLSYLSMFHYKLNEIVTEVSKLNNSVDDIHHEFLFKDLDDTKKQELKDLRTRFAKVRDEIQKKAGLIDMFHNVSTTRGRSLAAWEKRYPEVVKEIKEGQIKLLQQAESIFNKMSVIFTKMFEARKDRQPDKYVDNARLIINLYQPFNEAFKQYYNSSMNKYLMRQEELEAQRAQNPAPSQPVENNVEEPKPQSVIEVEKNVDPISKTMLPPPVSESEDVVVDLDSKEDLNKKSQAFLNSLESMKIEDPIILKKYIKAYANSIKNDNFKLSLKLIGIANSIKGG